MVAGTVDNDFAVARYNPDGNLDTSFSDDGWTTTYFGSLSNGNSVVVQPDGKIVVGGESNMNFALARYNPDGNLDISFSVDGMVTTDFGDWDQGWNVVLQSDRKIVLAGFASGNSNGDFALARYNIDGSLDNTFDGDGRVITDFGTLYDAGHAVTLQMDDKIVVVSKPVGDFAIARYSTDGGLDPSFSGDGRLITDFSGGSDDAFSVLVQPDGKIIAGGYSFSITSKNDFSLARYYSDGGLDTSFSSDGKAVIDYFSAWDSIADIELQPDGKVVAVGSTSLPTYDVALARFNQDGSLDIDFNFDGKLTTDINGHKDYGAAIVLQPDGKIIAVGRTGNDALIIRYK